MPPQAPPAPPSRDLSAQKLAIRARARDFEIAALLDLLTSMGYRPADIDFRGNPTETPQPTLVHRIEFAELDRADPGRPDRGTAVDLDSLADLGERPSPPPRRHPRDQPAPVTVTVNLGLLSCRSPLPSYFQHLLRDAAINEPLIELLRIIDRHLLRTRLTCDRPERIVDHWSEIAGDLLRMFSLDSVVGLSWLFRHVFPELVVHVKRTSEQLRVRYAPARLGSTALGSACFGALTRIDVHDFQVTLRCEDALLRPGVPWLTEVDRRLRTTVFPALDPVCMNLTVLLELEHDSDAAALRDDRAPLRDSYLGQDPLGRPGAARTVVLYRGLLPHDQPDTDELERALAAQARATVTAAVPPPEAHREPDTAASLELALDLGQLHRYHAVVRWGTRAWFRDEPYAIELHCQHLRQRAPSPEHHPQLWTLLRDRARSTIATRLTSTTLADYGVATATDAVVSDLIARGDDAALHALMLNNALGELPRATWERLLHMQSHRQ